MYAPIPKDLSTECLLTHACGLKSIRAQTVTKQKWSSRIGVLGNVRTTVNLRSSNSNDIVSYMIGRLCTGAMISSARVGCPEHVYRLRMQDVVWCGVVWCGVVWCGVVWCGVVWCGVVWCGANYVDIACCGLATKLSSTQFAYVHKTPYAIPYNR